MRFAYFPGCKIPHHLPEYGASVERVCRALGIGLVHLEFNCCGWPVRQENLLASMVSAMRNIALAAREGLSILTPCKCCFGNLKHALHRTAMHEFLAERVEELLRREGLSLARTEVTHLLTPLDRGPAAEALKDLVVRPLKGLRVACHYGCHALRPGHVTHFDDPFAPTLFERVIRRLGAEPVDWDLRLECCGHPLRGRDETLSEALMRKKLDNARDSGADAVATACTYCQLQFEGERNRLPASDPLHQGPRAVLFTRLVEAALGMADIDALLAR